MNTRSLLGLALVAIILAVYLGFFGLDGPGTKELKQREKQLFVIDAPSINRIELTTPKIDILLTQDNDQNWIIEKPIQYPANEELISRIISEIEFAEPLARLDFESSEDQMKTFGLNEPRIELSFRDREHSFRLTIGNETVRKGQYYATRKVGADADIVVINRTIEDLLKFEINDWRSNHIFEFETTAVTSVQLKDNNVDVALLKNANDWMIAKPFSGKTEEGTATSFLAGMLASRVHSFAPEDTALFAEYGLSAPSTMLDISVGEVAETLTIGAEVPESENLYYAQVSSRKAVLRVTGEFVDQVRGLLNRTRDKAFITAALNSFSGISVKQGDETWNLVVHADKWQFASDGQPVNLSALQAFYNQLLQAKAVDFYEKSEGNRSDLGLDAPVYSLMMRSPANDQDATSSTTYQIKVSDIQEQHRFVESDFVDFILKVPADDLPTVPESRIDWLSTIMPIPADDIWQSMTWNLTDSQLKLSKDSSGQWPTQWQGRDLNTDFLERQIRLLQEAEVIKRINLENLAPSLFTEDLSLTVTTSDEDYQLTFYTPEDRMVRIRVNGSDEGYLIHEKDYQILAVFPLDRSSPDSP